MRYATKRVILLVTFLGFYGFMGFVTGVDTSVFFGLLSILALFFVGGIFIITIKMIIKEDRNVFKSDAEGKIQFQIFFRRSIFVASFIDFVLVTIILSGLIDFSPLAMRIVESTILMLFIIIVYGVQAIIQELVPRNYNYYLYKASIYLAINSKSDKKNLHFLIALRYYDKYLRRRFGLAIMNLQNIFNRFLLTNETDRENVLKCLVDSEEDTLVPIKVFTNILNKDGSYENILAKDSYLEKLRQAVNFTIPIIAIIVTIIQFLVNNP